MDVSEVRNLFAQRLKQKREERGISQAELARRVGVGSDSYNKYERAGIQPSFETLTNLAMCLGTSVDYLLGNSENPNPKTELPPEFSYSFYNGYKKLDDDNRALLHDLMEKMLLSQKVTDTAED